MILIDLNVLLDVVQKREPHYRSSAAVLEAVVREQVTGALAAHLLTTIHHIVGRYQDRKVADQVIDWLLRYFTVASIGHRELLRARGLGWPDFEDAVVAAAAEASGCKVLVTRNVKDFRYSPVSACTPDEYLLNANEDAYGSDG